MHNENRQYLKSITLVVLLVIIVLLLTLVARPVPREVAPIAESLNVVNPDSVDSVVLELKPFDPNEADYRQMVDAGVPRNIAVSLLKWRETGKVFRIKEDVALCYGMTDSLYFILEPYINIGDKYRIKPNSKHSHKDVAQKDIKYLPFRIDTATAAYLSTIGFTQRQAELVVRYRDMIGGYYTLEEFAECYAVDDDMAQRLKPYIIFPERDTLNKFELLPRVTFPIEVNNADSATLIQVRGIGPKSIVHIMRYRDLLGGYYSIDQISELEVVTDENFYKISQQIWCDTAKIKKIYINFARPKELEVHPYVSNRMLRRIINHRELKGGWSTIEEMIDAKILSKDEAARIAPYLDFGTRPE